MKKSFIIALHISYWLLYLLLLVTIIMFMEAGGMTKLLANKNHIPEFLKATTSITLLPGVICFYVAYVYLFNRFLAKKKFVSLILSILTVSFTASFMSSFLFSYLSPISLFEQKKLKPFLSIITFMSMLGIIHSITALIIKGFVNWYADIKLKEELQQKNFDTELALVKSQLDPHFLFNSINNIDVLIKKDADKASLYLNKLSDIMRFMLYEAKTEKIPLEQELNYIEKYIELQKIRITNSNFIKYTSDGNFDRWEIAPMLFIPFIENAFKHSANKKKNNGIVIAIKSDKEALHFYCENQMVENPLNKKEEVGLGNKLLKQRLNLLYPGKHELTATKENNIYKVFLTIYADEN